jgi:hypothetical protein
LCRLTNSFIFIQHIFHRIHSSLSFILTFTIFCLLVFYGCCRKLDVLKAVETCFSPALFAHANGDTLIDPSHSKKLYLVSIVYISISNINNEWTFLFHFHKLDMKNMPVIRISFSLRVITTLRALSKWRTQTVHLFIHSLSQSLNLSISPSLHLTPLLHTYTPSFSCSLSLSFYFIFMLLFKLRLMN